MFSHQTQPLAEALTDLTQEPLIWKHWKHDHPELKRENETKITYNGDKILILGGYEPDEDQRTLNMVLMDPEKQTFRIIPSVGDVESCSWGDVAACYWKDSKIVVFGGFESSDEFPCSSVAIVTLKDLDSESPSAHWEKMVTPTELARSGSSAYIYQDRMYVIRGTDKNGSTDDIWCLDLTEFTWSQCSFKGYSSEGQRLEYNFVFHENKVYAIETGCLSEKNSIREFDLESLSYTLHSLPKSPAEKSLIFEPFPQVIDRKIYFAENTSFRSEDKPLIRQVLAFDLDSQNWTEINTESFPDLRFVGRMLYSKSHLIFNAIIEKEIFVHGEFWSLSLRICFPPLFHSKKELDPPKPSKYSSTSETFNKIQQTMKEFFFEAPYSDVSFEVESQVIPAHKWLLIQRNKFFANLFSSEMVQSSKIIINDLKASTFRALLEYLYSDHVEIDDTIALELLQQANKYFISGELKATCEKHLIQNIEPENYVTFGKLAELVGATSLRDAVVIFIAKNMKKIKPRKDFNDISDALLRDSIVKFIVK